jgi:hypothetical protein
MDWLKSNRIAPEPKTIAEVLHVSKRSVERWISELEAAHWLRWNRNANDPWRRYELALSNADEELVLTQIRALFASGEASVEAIDRILRNDNPVASDTAIKISDPPVAGFDRRVATNDSSVAGFDRTIISHSVPVHQDATNPSSPAHDGGGVSSYSRSSPTTTRSRRGASAVALTVTEVCLRAQGVSKKKARQFAHFDPHTTQHEWEAKLPTKGSMPEVDRQKLIGRLLDRWEVRPPALPPPADPPHDTEAYRRAELYRSAHFRAKDLLGPGAPLADMAIVVEALVAGASDAQALTALEAERSTVGAGLVPATESQP